jgi:hypothetical protein
MLCRDSSRNSLFMKDEECKLRKILLGVKIKVRGNQSLTFIANQCLSLKIQKMQEDYRDFDP